MAYDIELVNRIRNYLSKIDNIKVEEKRMFGGLAFMVNNKMCINVSGERLMCRYDPDLQEEVASRPGYEKMIMRDREYRGYCYVRPEGFADDKDFDYWLKLCLSFNDKAKKSKNKG